jgi:hypothetical protein
MVLINPAFVLQYPQVLPDNRRQDLLERYRHSS